MLRSVLAGLLVSIAGAVPVSHIATARAQDVQAYCATVGDDDQLRPVPARLVPDARRLFGLSRDTPSALVRKSTSVRCMSGKVWLCNYGANLICGKANASRVSAGAAEFCKQNPGSDSVPMVATGHDTIYEWKCVGKDPHIVGQIEKIDSRGFIAGNWKRLEQ